MPKNVVPGGARAAQKRLRSEQDISELQPKPGPWSNKEIEVLQQVITDHPEVLTNDAPPSKKKKGIDSLQDKLGHRRSRKAIVLRLLLARKTGGVLPVQSPLDKLLRRLYTQRHQELAMSGAHESEEAWRSETIKKARAIDDVKDRTDDFYMNCIWQFKVQGDEETADPTIIDNSPSQRELAKVKGRGVPLFRTGRWTDEETDILKQVITDSSTLQATSDLTNLLKKNLYEKLGRHRSFKACYIRLYDTIKDGRARSSQFDPYLNTQLRELCEERLQELARPGSRDDEETWHSRTIEKLRAVDSESHRDGETYKTHIRAELEHLRRESRPKGKIPDGPWCDEESEMLSVYVEHELQGLKPNKYDVPIVRGLLEKSRWAVRTDRAIRMKLDEWFSVHFLHI